MKRTVLALLLSSFTMAGAALAADPITVRVITPFAAGHILADTALKFKEELEQHAKHITQHRNVAKVTQFDQSSPQSIINIMRVPGNVVGQRRHLCFCRPMRIKLQIHQTLKTTKRRDHPGIIRPQ